MTTGYDSLKLEFAVGQDPMGSSLSWTDYSSSMWRASTTRGRQSMTDQFDAGSMTVTLRADTLSSDIAPSTPVRLSANDSTSTRRNIFTGFVSPQRSPWNFAGLKGGGVIGTLTVQCVDLLAVLSANKLPKLDTPTYGGNTAGTVIASLISDYPPFLPQWQTADIDDGQTVLVDLDLGEDALAVLQKISTSDGITAAVYADRDGNLVFDDAYSVLFNSRIADTQLIFDWSGGFGPTFAVSLQALLPLRPYTQARFRRITRIGSPENNNFAEDIQSGTSTQTDVFGLLTAPVVTILGEDTNVNQSRAQFYADVSSRQNAIPTGISLYPRRGNETLDGALTRDLRDRALVNSALGVHDVWVDRIGHDIDCKTKSWTVNLGFSDRGAFTRGWADPDMGYSPLILDDSTNGKLDQSTVLLGF